VRDNGITYNVYADAGRPAAALVAGPVPADGLAACWQQIEAGVLQRVQLLDRILDDVYGPQHCWRPKACCRRRWCMATRATCAACMACSRPAARRLHIAAFDIARDPDGAWWVVAAHAGAFRPGLPAGKPADHLAPVPRSLPRPQGAAPGRHLPALLESMKAMCPAAAASRIVLLTPGPYNETYFEHAYLARYLGLTLVEGSDLTVRDERLYLKTLKGLEPVHGVLKRLDDEFLDPLELRADSHLGVPGLLQAMRAGNVLVANAPGSGFLESTALLGFLPALSRHLLGEELKLPALATWWCGEQAAMHGACCRSSSRSVIKSTYRAPACRRGAGQDAVAPQLDEWAGRIVRDPGAAHRAGLPAAVADADLEERGRRANHPAALAMLRVFAVSDGAQGWRVLPGGLTRLAGENEIASMQRGGSSADTWVLTEGEVDRTSLLHHEHPAPVDTPHRTAARSPAARPKTCSGWAATPNAPRTRRAWRSWPSRA
jgi:uncharacterized circularly permuted ATP-grasp superfamily protein